jgi:diaminohydroxyphosphoribosylaminopyrimidine deaminase / 5-amino-6-(5-phosphoribosylamino)uracil reductase
MRLFSDDSSSIADPFLRRAWMLAQRGVGTTSPNPMVGCVIVRNGRVVGEGWHERPGGPHAEVVALRQAGTEAVGATAYVTLEPCAHHGRTPPCTDALVQAGVSQVVVGMPDPSEIASGGAERLRSAGIEVTFAEDPSPFEALNPGWLTLVRESRPWITVKVALSLDGKISAGPAQRTRISGPHSQAVTMRLRAGSDAVMVGARTAIADDSRLTVRDSDGVPAACQPLRVVFTRTTDPAGCSLFRDGRGTTVLLVPQDSALSAPEGAQTVTYDPAGGVGSAMRSIAVAGVARVLVEPGQLLFGALWDADLIDELVLIHAGGVAGGEWTGMYAASGSETDEQLEIRLRPTEAAVTGDDVVTVWQRTGPRREAHHGEEG